MVRQRVRRCHLPRGEGRPGWRVVADLEEATGGAPRGWSSAGEVLEELTGAVTAFKGSNGE